MALSKCKNCETELVDGPDVRRTGEAKGFRITIANIPTKICPRGCPGAYWYWLDFGVEVLDSLSASSSNIALRKFGFFKLRHWCRRCSCELKDNGDRADFLFHVKLRKGTEMSMTVNAPSLTCPQCGSSFMPMQRSTHDQYYIDLADTIGDTITKELIYR